MNDNPIVTVAGKQVPLFTVGRWVVEAAIVILMGYIAAQVGSVHIGLLEVQRKQIVVELQMTQLIEDQSRVTQLIQDVTNNRERIKVLETREGYRDGNR